MYKAIENEKDEDKIKKVVEEINKSEKADEVTSDLIIAKINPSINFPMSARSEV